MSLQSPEIRQFISDVGYLREAVDGLQGDFAGLSQQVSGVIQTQTNTPPAPVANLLYNGDLGHSVNSWFDSAYTTDDKSKECAHWFSHDSSLEGLTLTLDDARTTSTNKTLKKSDHSTYSAAYARWNSSNGWGELTGIKTLDAPLPSNFIDATTPLARVSLIAAKRSAFIEIPQQARMFAGIYDNTAGQLKFLTGGLGFTAVLLGEPAPVTVERRYRIHIVSDRGFTIVSNEISIPNAPADGNFSSGRKVALSWRPTAGQLRVDIYQFVPSTGVYSRIAEVSSSFGFIHLGEQLRTVPGYPTSTETDRKAVFYTRLGEMSSLATNAVNPQWDTINFPIGVPDNYSKAVTTGRQWLRIGLTVAPNLLIPGCASTGTTSINAPSAAFAAEHSALFPGLAVEVFDANQVLLLTSTVSSRASDTELVLTTVLPVQTGLILRVIGGGFHGVYVDKIHLGLQQNTSYAPNAFDTRPLQAVSLPESSSQGTVGSGGSGGGINTCVAENTPVKQSNGEWKRIKWCKPGTHWDSAEFHPNMLVKLRIGFDNVRAVISENGCYIECTDTERFACDRFDRNGTQLLRLRVGDRVLTDIDGRIESSKIVQISDYLGKVAVYTPALSGSHLFVAGRIVPTAWRRFLDWVRLHVLCRSVKKGGFVLHNLKYGENEQSPLNY